MLTATIVLKFVVSDLLCCLPNPYETLTKSLPNAYQMLTATIVLKFVVLKKGWEGRLFFN